MKIFVSHSSKDKIYGETIVDLLRNIGVKENEIVFTSNIAYGIPVGQNIFNWLKSQITENPFVIYLLSEEYYKSIACLNEMGAAWVIENKHAAIFTPNFNLRSKDFQSGALDPREIGFYINDEERILSFIQLLSADFDITKNTVIISQRVRKFLEDIKNIDNTKKANAIIYEEPEIKDIKTVIKVESKEREAYVSFIKNKQNDVYSKFINSITSNKMKDDELILFHYIIDTGRHKLMTGWQIQSEIDRIKEWEEVNNINDTLSKNYNYTLSRLETRGFTEVSAITSSNNPKEVKIKDDISNNLLDLPEDATSFIKECVERNFFEYAVKPRKENNNFPF